jgi:hypothetical protein
MRAHAIRCGTDLASFTRARMSHISFADLVDRRAAVSPAEAVALTLAVARILDDRRDRGEPAGIPPHDEILLSSSGDVSFSCVEVSTRVDEATQLARVLHRLLRLDEAASDRSHVPGGLLVALSRTLRQIDLPPLTRDQFVRALRRFAAVDGIALATLFWRAAQLDEPQHGRRHPASDRRVVGPSRTDLRRWLRDVERDLFDIKRQMLVASLVPPGLTRSVTTALGGAVLGMALALTVTQSGALQRAPAPNGATADGTGTPVDDGFVALSPENRISTPRAEGPLTFGVDGPAAAQVEDTSSPADQTREATTRLVNASIMSRQDVGPTSAKTPNRVERRHERASPDGRFIAFDANRDGVRGVYVGPVKGGRPRRVSGPGYGALPSWSPDGSRIAFVRAESRRVAEEQRRERIWHIWTVDMNNDKLHRVTRDIIGQPVTLSWFPNGKRLFYNSGDELVVIDVKNGHTRAFEAPLRNSTIRTPAVSPDGHHIVFHLVNDGLWLVDVGSGRMRRLRRDNGNAEKPSWAHDGSAVTYRARHNGAWMLARVVVNE